MKAYLRTLLGYFWVPKGTPMWRYHLPVMLFWVLVLSAGVVLGMYPVEYLVFALVVFFLLFVMLCALARFAFRNNPPDH